MKFEEPIKCTLTKEQLQILINLFNGKRHFEPEERWLLAYLKDLENKQ